MTMTNTRVAASALNADPGFDDQSGEAVRRILNNFSTFERHVARAYDYYGAGKLEAAAVCVSWAADTAASAHCGLFMSPRIEHLLTSIGRQFKTTSVGKQQWTKRPIRRILHISSQLLPVGGHSRMLRRWIESDPARTHDIAITQQRSKIPDDIVSAVAANGGRIHGRLNRRPGGLFAVVEQLRKLALEHDAIVLHTSGTDVAPSIAFADTAKFPPIVFLNHADHLFWVGAAISQVVGGMRDAAMRLAETRRRIEKDRSVLIPILVEHTKRTLARFAAKQVLGIAPDRIVLVSVARPDKYRTFNGVTYAELHVPILRAHPEATLFVVGAGERPDWSEAAAEVQGRIVPLPLQDPRSYMQSADIYLDSYPFCSATSMMEAGAYGTPCATRFMLPKEARICGMDHPGLFGPLIEALDDHEYWKRVSELIGNEELRERKGRDMLEGITSANVAPAWCEFMELAFTRAQELEPVDNESLFPGRENDTPHLGEPDIRIDERYGFALPDFHIAKEHLSSFPLTQRLTHWREVRNEGGFSTSREAARCMLPEWLVRIAKDGF